MILGTRDGAPDHRVGKVPLVGKVPRTGKVPLYSSLGKVPRARLAGSSLGRAQRFAATAHYASVQELAGTPASLLPLVTSEVTAPLP